VSADLRTRYLGLELANPVVPSASTLSSRIDTLKRLQDAGAAAVVFQSLFEEQIEHDEVQIQRVMEYGTESFAEATTYLPEMEEYNTGPDEYLRHLEASKRELQIPVIGSLNGSSEGGWLNYALTPARRWHRVRPRPTVPWGGGRLCGSVLPEYHCFRR